MTLSMKVAALTVGVTRVSWPGGARERRKSSCDVTVNNHQKSLVYVERLVLTEMIVSE
jgi:hypothetical protein